MIDPEHKLARAQARLRAARFAYADAIHNSAKAGNRAVRHLATLKGEVRDAERAVRDAEHARDGAWRVRRYMMLGA